MYNHIFINECNNGTMNVTIACSHCGCEKEFTVKEENFRAWLRHEMYVQEAFPELSSADREMFISGTCGECWNKMFGWMEEGESEENESEEEESPDLAVK